MAGATKPSLEGEGEGEKEWAPAAKVTDWDFPPETVRGVNNGFTDGGLSVYRLAITQGENGSHSRVKFAEPDMAEKLSMVAADTLRLMQIIFEVLGDSIMGMSRPATAQSEAAKKAAAPRPASAPADRSSSKKKGKKNYQLEALGAVEKAEMAEAKRLERRKALQHQFVEIHVAEKNRSRKEHLLWLYCDHRGLTEEQTPGEPPSDAKAELVSVEDAAEMDVMGGKREILIVAHGGNNVLMRPGPGTTEMSSPFAKNSYEVGAQLAKALDGAWLFCCFYTIFILFSAVFILFSAVFMLKMMNSIGLDALEKSEREGGHVPASIHEMSIDMARKALDGLDPATLAAAKAKAAREKRRRDQGGGAGGGGGGTQVSFQHSRILISY